MRPVPSLRSDMNSTDGTLGAATDNVDEPAAANVTAAEPVSRRRGVTLEQAIFDAVIEQMNTVGFSGLTMEGVASCARTGKAALYRRWPRKDDLVVDALNHVLPCFDSPPDTGSVRADIAEVFRRMLAAINSSAGRAILGLMGELDRDHPFIHAVQERVLGPRKVMMSEILERAVERGEIEPGAVTPLVAEAGPALMIHRLFCEGPPISPDYADAVLDEVVMRLLRPKPV